MSDDGSRYFSYKITIVGEGGVGKTSLIQRLTLETFNESYLKTIGANFYNYEYSIATDNANPNIYRLVLWDIAGQDDFQFLKPSFLKDSRASIIVFSLEENELGDESFNHIIDWYQDIRRICDDIPVYLFANKVDLVNPDLIDHEKIQSLVNKLNLYGYQVTSAKTGNGVEDAFLKIIQYLKKRQ